MPAPGGGARVSSCRQEHNSWVPRTRPDLRRAVCQCGLPGPRELPLTPCDPPSDPGRAELPAPFPSCTAFSQVCRWVAHFCRVKTTLSQTPGKFRPPDLCRRGKNDSSWETRGSHLLRWDKMRRPCGIQEQKDWLGILMGAVKLGAEGPGHWVVALRGTLWWAGPPGDLSWELRPGAAGRSGWMLKPQTLQPPPSTFFFFFMLRTPLVGAASSTVSGSAFSCVWHRGSCHDLCRSLFSHSLICVPVALGTCAVTLPTLCLA